MNHKKLSLALATALFALPLTAFAQEEAATAEVVVEEEESIFSWNAAIASDYVFRGVSQTDEEPALQLGADLNFDNGLYVGVWGSNVDFGDGSPDIEIDTYIGWNHDLTETWNLDLMLNRYNYIGEDEDVYGDGGDYNELIGAVAWNEMITLTVGYTNDIYNLEENAYYYGVAGSWDIGAGVNLGIGFGINQFDEDTGYEDYNDYSISINRDFGPVNAALGFYGTDADGEYNFGEPADNRFVLTLSIGG